MEHPFFKSIQRSRKISFNLLLSFQEFTSFRIDNDNSHINKYKKINELVKVCGEKQVYFINNRCAKSEPGSVELLV